MIDGGAGYSKGGDGQIPDWGLGNGGGGGGSTAILIPGVSLPVMIAGGGGGGGNSIYLSPISLSNEGGGGGVGGGKTGGTGTPGLLNWISYLAGAGGTWVRIHHRASPNHISLVVELQVSSQMMLVMDTLVLLVKMALVLLEEEEMQDKMIPTLVQVLVVEEEQDTMEEVGDQQFGVTTNRRRKRWRLCRSPTSIYYNNLWRWRWRRIQLVELCLCAECTVFQWYVEYSKHLLLLYLWLGKSIQYNT